MTVELYSFESPVATLRATPHEFAVALWGRRWEPLKMRRNEIEHSGEAAKNALVLTLPPECELVARLRNAWSTGEIFTVRVQAVEFRAESFGWVDAGILWVGRVAGLDDATDTVSARCEPVSVSMKRIGLRRLYGRRCSHVLYSPPCGAAPLSATAAVMHQPSATSVALDGVPLALIGALPGGWVQKTSGERFMVLAVVGNVLTLLTPGHFAPGETLTLVAGCDHTPATCAARFANIANYGGFPFVPARNPFSTGVF